MLVPESLEMRVLSASFTPALPTLTSYDLRQERKMSDTRGGVLGVLVGVHCSV